MPFLANQKFRWQQMYYRRMRIQASFVAALALTTASLAGASCSDDAVECGCEPPPATSVEVPRPSSDTAET